jgi:hypothetical protein
MCFFIVLHEKLSSISFCFCQAVNFDSLPALYFRGRMTAMGAIAVGALKQAYEIQ